jgi:NAD(P)-dependent dehydrogenase (short-subunit alcohol dehydrogenase family)
MTTNYPDNFKTGALITGASGGLGSKLVKQAAGLPGLDVVVATDIQANIVTQFSELGNTIGLPMDVGSERSIRQVKEELRNRGIRIRYIINNAGTHAFFPVSEATEALLDPIMRVNVYGQVLTVSVFLDDLITTRGRVVQVSSDSVRLPIPFYAYPASKMAQEAFSVSMRRELMLHGVRLILVRPGAMQTPFVESMKSIKNAVEDSRYTQWFNNFVKISQDSVGRKIDPEVVAALIMKALITPKPKHVYAVNKNRKINFFRYFPERLKDRLIGRSVA